ncbi:MAG TPA: Fis family transcriptional regulator [Oceanospirillaceae bacterium]|nr:Fis family transcriptional regulator [Oceanospirillaceae bacterium]
MNKHIGSSFDDFLEQEGTLEAIQAETVKRVIAWKLQEEINTKRITKTDLARRMETSRAVVDRVLDPTYTGNSLATLERAANASGMRLVIDLVPA